MKSLRLLRDGTGRSKLESLALPFLFFGPSATEADAARMPTAELVLAGDQVRAVHLADGATEDGGARRLLLVASGGLTVDASYSSATLAPGDVLLVEAVAGVAGIITARGDCRVVRVDVPDSWQPNGVVPPPLDERGRDEHAPPKVVQVYVEAEQARFRDLPELFDDPSPRSVESVTVMCLSPDSFGDWHTEDATNLVVVLAGGFELEVGGGGGAVEVLRAGDVCLVQDYSGQGHITRTHGETRFVAIGIPQEAVWTPR